MESGMYRPCDFEVLMGTSPAWKILAYHQNLAAKCNGSSLLALCSSLLALRIERRAKYKEPRAKSKKSRAKSYLTIDAEQRTFSSCSKFKAIVAREG